MKTHNLATLVLTSLLFAQPDKGKGSSTPGAPVIAPTTPDTGNSEGTATGAEATAAAAVVKLTGWNGNPFGFGAPIFTPSDSDKQFDRTDGLKSKKVANVLLEINAAGLYSRGTIYARQKGGGTPYVEFTFSGTMNQSSIVTLDEHAKAALQAFKVAVAVAYAGWRKEQGIAETKPTAAPTIEGVSFS